MLNLFKKKKKCQKNINITAQEVKQRAFKKFYNPTYEKIKKDLLKVKNGCYIEYEKAYIDKGVKRRLEEEGYYISEGTLTFSNAPYFRVYWNIKS